MNFTALSLLVATVFFTEMVESAFDVQHRQQLVPSQVLLRSRAVSKPSSSTKKPRLIVSSSLIPSQVIAFSISSSNEERDPVTLLPTSKPLKSSSVLVQNSTDQNLSPRSRPPRQRRRRQRNNQTKPSASVATTTVNLSSFGSKRNVPARRSQQTGRVPNIYWGAIPTDDLRQHPLFVPLPLPNEIRQLDCIEDVRNFRQDSWQWDALHSGRCTTSQLASALGFLNPKSAELLGIPRSMRSAKSGQSAYYRLSQQPLRTLEEMNGVLCKDAKSNVINGVAKKDTIWEVLSQPPDKLPFYARYQRNTTISDHQRHTLSRLVGTGALNGGSVRMMWGNTQESTAVLTALNYFSKKDPGVIVKEVGMCGAGLVWNTTELSESEGRALLIGASPDALLCYPNGRVEVIEVKNHCPFVSTAPPWVRNAKADQDKFGKRFMPLNDAKARSVPPQYLPQLMMEMFCVGPECKSAVMVRQTANNGAIILRVHRNDDWIDEMLFWLRRFHGDFVQQQVPPAANFFWNDDRPEQVERYKAFLQHTKEICAGVDVVDHVPNNLVQRATATSKSMFLD